MRSFVHLILPSNKVWSHWHLKSCVCVYKMTPNGGVYSQNAWLSDQIWDSVRRLSCAHAPLLGPLSRLPLSWPFRVCSSTHWQLFFPHFFILHSKKLLVTNFCKKIYGRNILCIWGTNTSCVYEVFLGESRESFIFQDRYWTVQTLRGGCRKQLADVKPPLQPHFKVSWYNTIWFLLQCHDGCSWITFWKNEINGQKVWALH